MNQKILIIGGGNIGTEFACEFAAAGYKVNIYTSRPERFRKQLSIVDSEGTVLREGTIAMATDDISQAMAGCLFIFVIVPAFMFGSVAKKMLPYIDEGMQIGVIPGTGGAEFAFADCVRAGAVLFGVQRVPSIARLIEYGSRVCIEGRKKELFLASVPGERGQKAAELMEQVFRTKCTLLPNYLNVTLTPSNPILHTTRLRTMFRDYREGVVYDHNILFYEEWTDESSQLLLDCDRELENMVEIMKEMDLTHVVPLRIYYESPDAPAMTAKIRSIKAFHGLHSPMKETEGGWVPDFDSRYFTADFSYGLAILIEIAHAVGSPVPCMEETMDWYLDLTGRDRNFLLSDAGIRDLNDIYRFYR